MSSGLYERQMKWKRHGEKKLALEARRLDDDRHGPCTFTPKTNRESRGRIPDASKLTHRAEVHAMQTHVARQHKARQVQDEASKRAFFLSTNKNFELTTTCKPFPLSKTNRVSRSPTRQRAQSLSPRKSESMHYHGGRKQSPTHRGSPLSLSRASSFVQASSNHDLDRQVQRVLDHRGAPDDKAWDKERSVLLSIIDAQRHELKLREKVHSDAAKIADKFATSVLAFEERLVAIETKHRAELSEMRRTMERSQASLQQILHALGVPSSSDEKPPSSKSMSKLEKAST
ncbi:hypothetical protein SPRG_00440 [Saprolegnia parasitica CBS 223.65]|uniref:Uncharacterized protein n=1 Tax=Saprolegnia parasitica (strain CBS 223.65) TaxID=695850 RepID=A0A067CYM6_SAPPC|nr:hypothetical protein SPRG_00440 [Saprolegnia parasitica CBS 223.65]KDO35598.1 hypothetical protein SPRG_00440 [Saprolegnia parasitica CBS 223.65]|eukprot:XP_012193929.1 hypothetical protein SPRG_00440 [Saprolegnia parasitica CBS 223.65]